MSIAPSCSFMSRRAELCADHDRRRSITSSDLARCGAMACVSALALGAFASGTCAGTYSGPGAAIPDAEELSGAPAFVSSEVEVTELISVASISVHVKGLVHSWIGDLSIELLHVPSGRSATLVFRVGLPPEPEENDFGDSSNVGGDYTWTDAAAGDLWATAAMGGTKFVIPSGEYFPSAAGTGAAILMVSEFAGIAALGTWRLTIGDWAAGDMGSFDGWTLAVDGEALIPCAETGSCFVPHARGGCDDLVCCQTVCALDPACCEVEWSESCVDLAVTHCSPCGGTQTGPCCEPGTVAGCAEAACCEAVCSSDLSCCTMLWDAACVVLADALEVCGCRPDPEPCPGTGCCVFPHPGVGCGDAACCETVCAVLPACCETSWDSACAGEALSLCCPSDVNGDGVVDGGDLGVLLASINQPGTEGDFDCNGFIDGADLGVLLALWGPCGE